MWRIRTSRERHWPELSREDYVRAVYRSMLTFRVWVVVFCLLGPGIKLMLEVREAAQRIDPPYGLVAALICLSHYLASLSWLLNVAIGTYLDKVREVPSRD